MSATYLRDPDNGYSGGCIYGRADDATVHHAESIVASQQIVDGRSRCRRLQQLVIEAKSG